MAARAAGTSTRAADCCWKKPNRPWIWLRLLESAAALGGAQPDHGVRASCHFAASRIADERIVRLDMAAGKQPTLQAAVEDKKDAVSGGSEHQAGAGDVTGIELMAGEGLRRGGQQRQDEFFAFGGFAVACGVELVQEGGDGCGGDHASLY